jgi:hypothetical protein
MSDSTIDWAGLRADLKDISQNLYPRVQLLRLPMNLTSGQIVTVPLPNAGNNLVLTYEALDEQNNYWQSVPAAGSITPGGSALIAQGFARFNRQGPWIPLSMFSPLMQGLASAAANYTANPIIGAGVSSVQMPIQEMEWQVLPAFSQAGFMLAYFGLNFGLRSGIGNGSGSTYAIPNASGPIDREAKARCGG